MRATRAAAAQRLRPRQHRRQPARLVRARASLELCASSIRSIGCWTALNAPGALCLRRPAGGAPSDGDDAPWPPARVSLPWLRLLALRHEALLNVRAAGRAVRRRHDAAASGVMTLRATLASPCRVRRSGRRHACSAHHAELVRSYRDARAAWELERDAACGGYAGDEQLWTATHPGPTFGAWLRALHGQADESATAA